MAGENNKVILFGSAKMSQLFHFFLEKDSPYEVAAFTVDGKYIDRKELGGLPLVPFEDILDKYSPHDYKMLIAIGYKKMNKIRAEKYKEAKEKGYEFISYISSKATLWGDVKVGENSFISENTVIYPWTEIGNNVIIRSSCYIGHDAVIKDHCWISPSACINGSVTVGEYSFIGANSTIRDKVTVGSESLIGAGSVILNNTEKKGVYISNRAERYSLDSERFVRMMNI